MTEFCNQNPYPPGVRKSTIRVGSLGPWSIEKFTVPDDATTFMMNFRYRRDGEGHRVVPPGNYTRLYHAQRGVVMSDTPAEAWENYGLFRHARGRVLINGLGMGWALENILCKPEVERITVVEIDQDILNLVGKHFIDERRVLFICADAMKWRPGKGERFDCVWHDIWDNMREENVAQASQLMRSYGQRTAYQGYWAQKFLKQRRRA